MKLVATEEKVTIKWFWVAADGTNDIHLVKDAPIPAGSALQILDGGSKIVVQSGDALKVISDTASSLDVWVSAVDDISS